MLTEVGRILRPRWLDRIIQPSLTGEKPAQLRLTWTIEEAARRALEAELFGKRILVTGPRRLAGRRPGRRLPLTEMTPTQQQL